jgi:hypothetical protein
VQIFEPHRIGNFSGTLFYYSMDDGSNQGLVYERGKVTHILKSQPPETVASRSGCYFQYAYINNMLSEIFLICPEVYVYEGGGGWEYAPDYTFPLNPDAPSDPPGGGYEPGSLPPIDPERVVRRCPDGSSQLGTICRCADGNEMPSDGVCQGPLDPPAVVNCTAIQELVARPFDATYAGICYPIENCYLSGQVTFSPSAPSYESIGITIVSSSVSGRIPNGGGSTSVTFVWAAKFDLILIARTITSVEVHSIIFNSLCCP